MIVLQNMYVHLESSTSTWKVPPPPGKFHHLLQDIATADNDGYRGELVRKTKRDSLDQIYNDIAVLYDSCCGKPPVPTKRCNDFFTKFHNVVIPTVTHKLFGQHPTNDEKGLAT